MKLEQIFTALREPSLADHMPSRDAFKYLECCMTAVGWLKPSKDSRYSCCGLYLMSRAVIFIFSIYIGIGFLITYITEFHAFTVSELFTSMQVAINTPCGSLRGFITFMHIWRLALLKDVLDKLDKSCTRVEEKDEVHRRVKLCNSIYLTYLCIYVGFSFLKLFSTAPMGVVPWHIYIPYIDWRNGPLSLWVASLLETFLMESILLFNHLNDCYPFLFGTMIRLHLKLLQTRVENLRSNPNQSEAECLEELIGCINDLKLIREACNIMKPYISSNIFIQFLMVGLLFGFTMVGMMVTTDLLTLLSSINYTVGLICQTFPFCYTCTLISADCDDLSVLLFHSHWINASQRYKTTLIQFLHNTQQTITFQAGYIFDICLSTNISVAKLAFSVVTFVKQMNIYETLKNN
ncbi:hypothetical protein KR222_002609 [Zaprionus bogoriensis]|nr:hypothetical protein KR222_002609 [Zaprionus bogoriensis]